MSILKQYSRRKCAHVAGIDLPTMTVTLRFLNKEDLEGLHSTVTYFRPEFDHLCLSIRCELLNDCIKDYLVKHGFVFDRADQRDFGDGKVFVFYNFRDRT